MKLSNVATFVVLLATIFQGVSAGGAAGRHSSKDNEDAASSTRNNTDVEDDDADTDEPAANPRFGVVLMANEITGRKRHVNMNLPGVCKPPKPTKRARNFRTQANSLLRALGDAILTESGTMRPGVLDALQGTDLLPTFQAKALELEIVKRRDHSQSLQSYELDQLRNRFSKTILDHPTLGNKITKKEVEQAWDAIKESIEARRFKEIEEDLEEVHRLGCYAIANPDEVCGPKIDKKKKRREDDDEPDGLGGGPGGGLQGLVA